MTRHERKHNPASYCWSTKYPCYWAPTLFVIIRGRLMNSTELLFGCAVSGSQKRYQVYYKPCAKASTER